ncbi:MAG: MCE family protein [Candidatus Omnitrophica bacterium]|nr:MCE family protein [Candidatus Omnitrophota bacterium]
MAKDDGLKQFWAGIFFVAGLAVVGGVILFLGVQKGLTEPRVQVVILFDKVGGLGASAPVRLSGVTVGSVADLSFLPEEVMGRGLKVTLDIYRKYEYQVKRCTKVSIQTEGVLGAKYIEIGRVAGEAPLDIAHPILGSPFLDVYDLAGILQDTATSFNQTTKGINVMVVELKYISRKTKRLLDRIEQRVIDGNLFKVF